MDVVKPGDKAVGFILKDHKEVDQDLSSYLGKKVLLSFHPLAWTDLCAKQMKSLEANIEEFKQLNTVPFGISVDSVPCKAAWAKELKVEQTSLLSDFWPHGAIAESYGVFREKNGTAKRANIVVDEKGLVIFAKTYPTSELPDIQEVLKFIRDNA